MSENGISNLNQMIVRALAEDRVQGDITTRHLVPAGETARAVIYSREEGVICGLDIVRKVFRKLDPGLRCRFLCRDGQRVRRNTALMELRGKARALLSGERTALNFLGHLSGIATQTAAYVRAVPARTKILDTRKTTPGLRALEKRAVRCGGGHNHRHDLAEMALIKDNHIAICRKRQGIAATLRALKRRTRRPVEVEVDNLRQFDQILEAGADIILLDNMNVRQIRMAVRRRNALAKKKRPLLEASGGINLKTVKRIGQTGVDRISVGALTHSVRCLNVSMEFQTK